MEEKIINTSPDQSINPAQITPSSPSQNTNGILLPSIEELIKKAFKRTKERILSYYLAAIIGIAVIITIIILCSILIGIVISIGVAAKLPVISIILGTIIILFLISLLYYFSSWMQLSTIKIVISPKNFSAGSAYKETKPLVWGLVKLQILIGLFFLGLLIFSILSIMIIFLLWAFWASFATFVYLEHNQKGLANLWASRQMINQKFWGVAGRIFLVNLVIYFIAILLNSSGQKEPLLNLLSVIFSLLTAPFLISYSFEIFSSLQFPQTIKAPKTWIALSIFGGVLLILGLIAGVYFSITALSTVLSNPEILENILKNIPREMLENKPTKVPYFPTI